MKIFISAAETSSDIHAEKILKSIQKKLSSDGVSVEWMGIGGPRVCALPNFTTIESSENLRTMGLIEVLKKISFFNALIERTAKKIQEFDPDLILTFDYPDFHFRLIEKVVDGNLAPNALRVCGIPPKVWVWRAHRVEKIRQLYHGVWVIFPFEKRFYETHGIPVIYEGNPLLEDLLVEHAPAAIMEKKPLETITVMPGSRDGELKCHLQIIPETLELFAKKIGKKITAQVPLPQGVEVSSVSEHLVNTKNVEYIFLKNTSAQSLRETQIGLIKSGTSTLEAAVLNCIPVIFYKMNWLSERILMWFIKNWGGYLGPAGLPNILLGVKKRKDSYFPEFLGAEAAPEKLSQSLYSMYLNLELRAEQLNKCKEVRDQFLFQKNDTSTADRSADQILSWKKNPPQRTLTLAKKKSVFLLWVSFVWSSINWFRRRLSQIGLLPVYDVVTPSILVGNLQAGGAGKTPLVIALAKEAIARGKKVAVVSRGYGSTKENPLGDEPMEILAAVPGVIVSVGANRVKAIHEAEKQKPDLIIFDDGFQNLRFRSKKYLIAVTDRKRSEVAYRDFDSEIKFADIIVGTKGTDYRQIFTQNNAKFFQVEWQWDNPLSQPVWMFCAIADPVQLLHFYQERGLVIKKLITKPDHGLFSTDEVKKMMDEAKSQGCILATTQKDSVKIPTLPKDVYILSHSIRNRDWMDAIFASKLE